MTHQTRSRDLAPGTVIVIELNSEPVTEPTRATLVHRDIAGPYTGWSVIDADGDPGVLFDTTIDAGYTIVDFKPSAVRDLPTGDFRESLHPPFVQTVERDVVVERRTELMGVFPHDPVTQRAWAIDRAVAANTALSTLTLIEQADAILAYVLGPEQTA